MNRKKKDLIAIKSILNLVNRRITQINNSDEFGWKSESVKLNYSCPVERRIGSIDCFGRKKIQGTNVPSGEKDENIN